MNAAHSSSLELASVSLDFMKNITEMFLINTEWMLPSVNCFTDLPDPNQSINDLVPVSIGKTKKNPTGVWAVLALIVVTFSFVFL